MTGSLAGLLVANGLYLVIGAGLLPLLGIARTRDQLRARLGLAYMVGLTATGIVSAHLALVGLGTGWVFLSLAAAAVAVAGFIRARGLPRGSARRAREWLGVPSHLVGVGAFVVALALLAHAAAAAEVRPFVEWDGWAIWGMKARALYDFGGVAHGVFTTDPYAPLMHPLFLPALEANGFRAMGAFDSALIHVQLVLLAFGFAAALWSLLRDRVPAALAGAAVLAIAAAHSTLSQLAGNLADIPLAFLVALGVVALARTLAEEDRTLLVPAAIFLGAAALTKPEGLMFAAAALVPYVLLKRTRAALVTAGAVALLVAPWWLVYVPVNHLKNPEYDLVDVFNPWYLADHSDRARPALEGLWHQIWSGGWGLLVPFALVSFAGALAARRWRLAGFATAWSLLSFAGLLAILWVSTIPIGILVPWTSYRIVDSLVLGAAALAPLLAGEAWRTGLVRPAPGQHGGHRLRQDRDVQPQ